MTSNLLKEVKPIIRITPPVSKILNIQEEMLNIEENILNMQSIKYIISDNLFKMNGQNKCRFEAQWQILWELNLNSQLDQC